MRIIIDVGGTKTLVLAVDSNGKEVSRNRFLTDEDYTEYKAHLTSEMQSMVGSSSDALEGIAVAIPGVIDYQTKHAKALGNRDWKDVDLAEHFEKTFKVPVALDNDANFGAIGEARSGAGQGYRVVLYITISTGIGTGVAVEGQISPALARSEAGAMHFEDQGKLVQWESIASGKAFFEKYERYARDTPAEEVEIWKEYASKLAIGFEELIAIIQPDVIVVGGSMGEHLDKYLPYVIEILDSLDLAVTTVPPIVAAKNPDEAVINGGIEAVNDLLKT